MYFKHKLNNKTVLILIVFLALIVRCVYFYMTPLPLNPEGLLSFYPDENVYYNNYLLIEQKGFFYALLDEQSLWTAPLNPIYIYLLSGVTSQPILFIRIFNILVAAFSIVPIYKIAIKLFNHKVAVFSSLFMALYFPLIEIAPTLLTEPIYIFFILMASYWSLLAISQDGVKLYVYAGLFMALATLTRSTFLLAPFFLLLVMYLVFKSNRKIIRGLVVLLISFGVVVGPFILKNYILFDRFAINNGSGAVLFLGSRADTEGDEPPYRGKEYSTYEITAPYTHLQSEGDDRLKEVAINNIRDHLFGYVYWDVKKIGRLLVGNNHYWYFPFNNIVDYYHNLGFGKSALRLLNMLGVIIIVVLGLYEMLVRNIKQVLVNPVTLIFIYHTLIYLPFLVNHRYGLPLVCLLSMFCGMFFFREKVGSSS
ncbi:4-amino-4-deoxy-L-arabinose transferase-like glycosyltransferase [Paenibacillus intestini]|nr:glycosyltransferase family 39 protein [Paenibacillus amylolyticus]MDP9702718.1 4-amino-4-deoxy-L-arabinose transferase-like glycosyltransferase [Paenibacillus intestini]